MALMPRGRHPSLGPKDEFEIWQQREAGISIRDCAAYHQVSRTTILRVLAKMRQKFGRLEKLPNERRARASMTRPIEQRQI